MKKFSLIMIIVWSFIGLAIVAALMLSIMFFNKGGSRSMTFFNGNDRSNMQLVVDEAVPMQDIDKIELSFSADECNIYIANDDKIAIKHYARGIPAGRYAKLDRAGGLLTVSTKPSNLFGFSLFGFTNRSIVDIYLPSQYKDVLGVELMSGTLRFDGDLDLSELSVHISSGTIRSEHAVKAQNVDISVTSGTVRLTGGIEAENYALKTSSGTIDVGEKLSGSGSVNVTSGTIRLAGVDISEDLIVKASSGTINIGIAGNPSIRYSGRRSSGTIRAYFDLIKDGTSFSGTVGEAPFKNLDVSVTSGTIRITQE